MTFDEYKRKVSAIRGYDISQDTDYDWEAAYKDGYMPEKGHGTDKYKRPSHPTFSDESMYHGINGNEGGRWEDMQNGLFNFIPGKTNLQWRQPKELQQYFDQFEPDATLILPQEAH